MLNNLGLWDRITEQNMTQERQQESIGERKSLVGHFDETFDGARSITGLNELSSTYMDNPDALKRTVEFIVARGMANLVRGEWEHLLRQAMEQGNTEVTKEVKRMRTTIQAIRKYQGKAYNRQYPPATMDDALASITADLSSPGQTEEKYPVSLGFLYNAYNRVAAACEGTTGLGRRCAIVLAAGASGIRTFENVAGYWGKILGDELEPPQDAAPSSVFQLSEVIAARIGEDEVARGLIVSFVCLDVTHALYPEISMWGNQDLTFGLLPELLTESEVVNTEGAVGGSQPGGLERLFQDLRRGVSARIPHPQRRLKLTQVEAT